MAGSEKFPISGSSLPAGGGGVDGNLLVVGDVSLAVDELPSQDPTHLSNLASACAVAMRMGASRDGIGEVARSFTPGRHRRTVVADAGGIKWVNDSKATNLHAALSSIRAHRSVVLIAGGLAKGIDLSPIAAEANVRALIGIGEAGPDLVAAAGRRGHLATDLEHAVDTAAHLAEPGDTVLLAPGCASFDQFDSYEARGDRFTELAAEKSGGDS